MYRCTGSCKASVQIIEDFLAEAETKPKAKGVVGTGGRVYYPDRSLGGYAQIDDPDKIQPVW